MKKWDRRTYVDLFAGPGRCYEYDSGQFYDGSPLIELRHNFTDHVFVELAEANAVALADRCRHRRPKSSVVIEGDCNTAVEQVVQAMPSGGIALAFVDPTSWQIRFSAIQQLTAERRVDLLVCFFAGMMKRVVQYDQPKLDAFFGTTEWRASR
jgi:three-Cys-motif partner protein